MAIESEYTGGHVSNAVLLGELRQGFKDLSTRLDKLEGRVDRGEATVLELAGHHTRRQKLWDAARTQLFDKGGFLIAGILLAHARWP